MCKVKKNSQLFHPLCNFLKCIPIIKKRPTSFDLHPRVISLNAFTSSYFHVPLCQLFGCFLKEAGVNSFNFIHCATFLKTFTSLNFQPLYSFHGCFPREVQPISPYFICCASSLDAFPQGSPPHFHPLCNFLKCLYEEKWLRSTNAFLGSSSIQPFFFEEVWPSSLGVPPLKSSQFFYNSTFSHMLSWRRCDQIL